MSSRLSAVSRLQAAREAAGLTRREVGARIEMTEKQLERWEKGKTPVKRLHLLALAEIYGVSVEELEDAAGAGVPA